jgi:eukaryotic-like serine/threonine-protein kinase
MESNLPKKIGKYGVLSQIGKGGMGEVYLVKDPDFNREIALKRIRPELMKHEVIKKRFLREACLTAQLTHPGIISIHAIHQDTESLYYLMPYIPGETLKKCLKDAHLDSKSSSAQISKLLPIFHSLCQTVSYAHSQGILHRDIKPENVLVGKFGEVILLDWGLAQRVSDPENDEDINLESSSCSMTSPGKMVGTVSYMAPERAQGSPSSYSTDIYALGVILYQILTLRFPFRRNSIKEFRQNYDKEVFVDPEEAAPYRDVPPALSLVAKKCLENAPSKRYASVGELVRDLESHLAGNSRWFLAKTLSVKNKKHWQFNEHFMLSRLVAITGNSPASEWFGVMFSRTSFAEKIRIETTVTLKEGCAGMGLILGAPVLKGHEHLMIGYSLWLGAEGSSCVQLYRNTVEVMRLQDLCLKIGVPYKIEIEREQNTIRFCIDSGEIFTHVNYIPLFGTHLGVIYKDMNFEAKELNVFVGSHDLEVSCLSVPDAFLANRDYKRALSEYRRISQAFPGHQEGREALFRAGYTLLQHGKQTKGDKERYYDAALDEFAKLHDTPGAPLEYLGKALVYQTLKEPKEELKALELGLRRYINHPHCDALKEHILFRMHQASIQERWATYQLIIVVLRLMPQEALRRDMQRLFKNLVEYWEPLPFLESNLTLSSLYSINEFIRFLIPLAAWTDSPYLLEDLFHEVLKGESEEKGELLGDILFCLYELGCFQLAKKLKKLTIEIDADPQTFFLMDPLDTLEQKGLQEACTHFISLGSSECGVKQWRIVAFLIRYALREREITLVHKLTSWARQFPLSKQDQIECDAYRIWAHLYKNELNEVEMLFDTYSLELVNQETTLLHPLFGCWLLATEGEEIATIHFNGVTQTPYPRTWALLGHELSSNIQEQPLWYNNSFLWERRALFAQLSLYYHIRGENNMEAYYTHLEKKEFDHAS